MTGFIPEEKISEIKNAADIVDVVSESVALKKTGRNYLGLCPFHSEKTPSFSVSPEKQIYHCFGCGAGGNVFGFIMKKEGLSFPETIGVLAKRYGIALPTRQLSPEQKRKMTERESLLEINRLAAEFYGRTLVEGSAGKVARAYLAKRKINRQTIERFKIGYAPDSWERLHQFLVNKRIPSGLVEASGLVIPRKSRNGFYDRFRNRIVFPILAAGAQVIGFGGRVLDDAVPKYLNSPESPVYNKRRSLYGIHQAKNSCRERESVFIVEGYFDLLALHQHGIEHSVATLGTALSAEHVRILKGLVGSNGRITLVFDSDEAGIKAAERCIEVFDKEYVNAQILILPEGYDPDSYLMEYGPDAFLKRYAEKAMGIVTFLTESAVKKHGLSLEGRIQILADLQKPLASLADKTDRAVYIKALSERIGVEESAVLDKVRQLTETGPANPEKRTPRLIPRQGENRLERQIVAMMLQYPAIISEIAKRQLLEKIKDERLQVIGRALMDQPRSSDQQVSDLMTRFDDSDLQELISDLAFQENVWDLDGCLKCIKQFESSCDRRAIQLRQKIEAAERENNPELVTRWLQELQQIQIQARKK